ncbi:hypothetical protein GS534_24210 [Rhodococcus hoagii]|nr:hypothetical protein [Prescottella equi]MBM4617979.1 hypothetical protein [Prescottella equi]MBM4618349.1 hypothetical protein [Prescottella equi]MBM4618363.1 hypothetical protein [Prescottella equi]MBM4618370.1 hypothetical protein [Prescottella equi]
MTLRDKVAHYRKAVAAGIGSVLMLLTSFLALGDVLPSGVAVVLTTVLAVLTTLQVWLLKNADLIDSAAGSIDDLHLGVRNDLETRGKHAR